MQRGKPIGLVVWILKPIIYLLGTSRLVACTHSVRVRFHIIRNARIENVGKSQSCMVSKLRFIWKQTVVWRRASEGLATVVDDSSPLCATTRDDRATLVFPGMCVFGVGGTWVEEWSPAQIRAEIAESWAGQQEVRLTLGWPRLSSPYGGLTGYHRSQTVATGACTINLPCAQQYVGKYQSCMVISGRDSTVVGSSSERGR